MQNTNKGIQTEIADESKLTNAQGVDTDNRDTVSSDASVYEGRDDSVFEDSDADPTYVGVCEAPNSIFYYYVLNIFKRTVIHVYPMIRNRKGQNVTASAKTEAAFQTFNH